MPSPVGHTLAGCCVAAAAARSAAEARPTAFVATLLVAANLPDADFLLGPLLRPLGVALAHQGATHSFAFVAAGAALLALTARGGGRALRAFGWLLAAGALHLFLDYVSHDDHAPVGLPLLWPLSASYFHAPLDLFPGTDRDDPVSVRNALQLLAELTWTLPPLVILLRGRPAGAARQGRP